MSRIKTIFEKIRRHVFFKISFSIFIIIFVIGSFTSFFVFFYVNRFFFEIKEKNIAKIAKIRQNQTKKIFDRLFHLTQIISKKQEVIDFFYLLKNKDKKINIQFFRPLDDLFAEYKKNYYIQNFYLLDKEGKVIFSTDKKIIGKKFLYYFDHLKIESIKEYIQIVLNEKKSYSYLFFNKVYDKKENSLGFLVIDFDRKEIEKNFNELLADNLEEKFILFDNQGNILYLKNFDIADFVLLKNFSSFSFSKKFDDEKNFFIKVKNNFFGAGKVEGYPYYFFFKENFDDIKIFFNYSLLSSLFIFFAANSAIFICFYSLRRFFSPFSKIHQFALNLKKGDFKKRLVINRNDEWGDLSKTLNKMAESLEKFYQNLDKKVKEKTRDLEKFKLAVDNASDQIVITDKEGKIIFANKATTEITGFSVDEIIGKKAGGKELWGGLMDKKFYEKFWYRIKIQKKSFKGQFENKRKNGERYIAEAHVSPILDERGEVVFFVGIEQDVTREKKIDQMKTEFISLASHQLKTPLSAVRWFLEMLINKEVGELNEKQLEFLKNIQELNLNMISLVNSLLNISRIELGRIIIDPEPTDLKELIENTVREIYPKLKEKEQEIIIDFDPRVKIINVDRRMIREVFLNLISNSIKYSPAKSKIFLSFSIVDDKILFKIKDQGIGIPKNEQHRIFSRFFRGSNAIKKVVEGNGLGLYLVKSIIESSGGKIWFESEEGKGTTFYFTLPLKGMKRKKGEVYLS